MRTLADFEAEANNRRKDKIQRRRPDTNIKRDLARLRGSHKETVDINKMLSAKLAEANSKISILQDLVKAQSINLEKMFQFGVQRELDLETEKDANAYLRAKNIALEALTQ
jgi:hypothetical protein